MSRFASMTARFGLLLLIAGLGIYSCVSPGFFGPGIPAAYLLLMVLPGVAFYLLANRELRPLELVLAGVVLSPALVGGAAVVSMTAGFSGRDTAVLIACASAILCAAALVRGIPSVRLERGEPSGRHVLALAGVIVAFCVLVGYLPLVSEWWRLRTDGYFHTAVIAQIEHFGVPPEDPYFYGMRLQYMWFFHVLAIVVSHGTHLDPSFAMPLFNIQTLAGYILATFLVSFRFTGRFTHGVSSVLVAVLGLNALFWLFLPIELARAFWGEVTGMAEITRVLSLRPFDIDTIRGFLTIFHNQCFFLDKFLVMTPFSFGLCFMAAAWYGATQAYSSRGKDFYSIAFTAIVCAGMLAFHPVVGFVVTAGLGGGYFLLLLSRSGLDRSTVRITVVYAGALILGVLVLSPYLYGLMHGKGSGGGFPVGLSASRTIGIIISCALPAVLAACQIPKLVARGTPGARYFLLASLSVVVVSLLIVLPGPNAYGKPPFFVFYPLAVAGGWTLADLTGARRDFLRKPAVIVAVYVLLLAPVNLLALLAYFHTSPDAGSGPDEREMIEWVGRNTSREAVFIDCGDRTDLVTAGPRRYFFGSDAYAEQWDYDKAEMDLRRRVLRNLCGSGSLEASALSALAGIEPELYVIAREDDNRYPGLARFAQNPDIFRVVHAAGPIGVFQIDKDACAARAVP